MIKEASQKIQERNKYTSCEWETVNQYVTNPVESDSDYEIKFNKAKNPSSQKVEDGK